MTASVRKLGALGAVGSTSRRTALAAAAVAFSLLPVLLVAHLPLVDYPNHLARFEIFRRFSSSEFFATFYEWRWGFIPNLALDLLVIPVTYLLPVEAAANLVTLLALVVLCLGTIQLDRELHGDRWGVSSFVGLIVYSGAFRYGFVNYVISVSLALVLFVLWVRLRPRLSSGKLALFTVAGALLLLMHLYAFGLYAVCVAGFEFSLLLDQVRRDRRLQWRNLALPAGVALSLAAPLCWLLTSPTSTNAAVTRWSTIQWKAEAVLSPVFFNQPWIELPLFAVLASLVGLGLLTGTLRIHRRMIWSMAVFAVLCVAMPRTLFGSNYADYRLLSGVGFFFLASLEYTSPSLKQRQAVVLVLMACLFVRVGSVLADWIPSQAVIEEYDDAFAYVRPGAKVLVLQGRYASTSESRRPPLEHVPVFAAAKRDAFVAYIFTGAPMALQFAPAYKSYEQFSPYPELARDMARFDYVLAINDPAFDVPEGLSLTRTAQGRTYTLSEVKRSDGTAERQVVEYPERGDSSRGKSLDPS